MHDLLQRWEAAIQEGRAPDPHTWQGFAVYFAIGLAIGWSLSLLVF